MYLCGNHVGLMFVWCVFVWESCWFDVCVVFGSGGRLLMFCVGVLDGVIFYLLYYILYYYYIIHYMYILLLYTILIFCSVLLPIFLLQIYSLLIHSILVDTYIYLLIFHPLLPIHSILVETYIYLLIFHHSPPKYSHPACFIGAVLCFVLRLCWCKVLRMNEMIEVFDVRC